MSQNQQRYPRLIPWLRTFLMWAMSTLVKLLTRLHVEGQENVPMEGPLIIVANHLHHLDSPVVGGTVPREDMWGLAGEKYERHPFFGPILKGAAGAIFIQRGEIDRAALRQALNVLEDGHCLAIAPEGTRSKTGGLQRPKTGAAYLASRSGATLQPVVTWGTEQIIPAWTKLKRANVYVRYGQPFQLPPGRARADDLETYTDQIMLELARLLPEMYHGVYAGHPALTVEEFEQAT